MRVLVIGSGAREQAISWACRRHGHDVTISPAIGDASKAYTDLVIPGPEAALVDGAANIAAERGIPCFGPLEELAFLESSKSQARVLASSLGIPSPKYARFTNADAALAWWEELGLPVVVKLDGLAAGKGVTVPSNDDETRDAIAAAALEGPFLLEERLHGPEVSLLAMCDGGSAVALPLAQDHKRIGEGDIGPNTGGMGAFAPAPVPFTGEELIKKFVQPILTYFDRLGTPYVGVIFAGLMLTDSGPRLIEYNIRFGDPEAQAVLPLLETDLAEIALACTTGDLKAVDVKVSDKASVALVAAAHGYPGVPHRDAPISDSGTFSDDAFRFDAGVNAKGQTAGGRILTITGIGDDLASARARAYERMDQISFFGMQVRQDIAWRAPGAVLESYAAAGVDIDEGSRAVEQMKDAVESTHQAPDGWGVLKGVGSFGGVFSAKAITTLDDPVLVASADGVGTKVELAARLGLVRGVGMDIVNHCIDDVLVQSAKPLFFLDYIAASTLDASLVTRVVTGMAEACEAAGCALLGGETAEMPGVYQPGAFDIAGTLIGVAERSELLPRDDVAAGDVLIGVGSSGPHTNGYSLLRKIFEWIPMDVTPDGFEKTLGETLLEPHRSYLHVLTPALDGGCVKALAHITGGGLPENLPRVLPSDVDANIELGSWPISPLFQLVRDLTPLMPTNELYRTLNMGIGMVVVCAADDATAVQASIDEPTWIIGEVVAGKGNVNLR